MKVNKEIKPTNESRQIAKTPERFTIVRTDGYGYKVSIPNYDGGEVVKAEAYDALCAATRELLNVMDIQENRDSGAFHLSRVVFRPMWDDAKAAAIALVGSPVEVEEGT